MKIVSRAVLIALLSTATPVIAQTQEPDMVALVDSVTTIAGGLSDRVATLGDIISATTDGDEAARALDEMLDAARQMQADLGRDSAVWQDINAMLEVWGERRDDLRERGVENQALVPIAETWQARIDEALTLREQILNQSAESQALIEQIEAQRDVVIALYDANLADQALDTMRAISDELGQMNEQMGSIVSQAGIVAEPSNLANE
ncbi:hypothetical protein [Yoonia sp.]|uniref:hypothetical protein n=1 Tax=Yoonia sp. TaxID=2212373 RepID=UPI002FD999E3